MPDRLKKGVLISLSFTPLQTVGFIKKSIYGFKNLPNKTVIHHLSSSAQTKLRLVALKITLGYKQAKHWTCGKHQQEELLIPSDQRRKETLEEKIKCGNRTDYILSCKEEHPQEQTEVWQNNFIKQEMNLLRALGRSWVPPPSPQKHSQMYHGFDR